MEGYNDLQLNTVEVMKKYYELQVAINQSAAELMVKILNLHVLRKTQGWNRSDEILFKAFVCEWESLKMRQQEVTNPLEYPNELN